MRIKEGDRILIEHDDSATGKTMELVVEVLQIMDKILVKEPDDRSFLEGGHRPFLIEDDVILDVVEPVEEEDR